MAASEIDLEVAVIYRPEKGPPFLVATLLDEDLVRLVSEAAIKRGYARAELLAAEDEVLAAIERGETERLRQTMEMLLPARREVIAGVGERVQ